MHSRQAFGAGPQQFHGTFQPLFQSVPPHTNDLNKVAKELINEIAESNEHVTCHKIEALMLQKYKVASVIQLGLVNIRQLPCIHDLDRLETLVNTTVEGYICRRGICTLYDLDLHILDLLKRNNNDKCPVKINSELTSFEDLKLGPFNKLTVVFVLFQVSPNKPIFKLTTIKLLTHLIDFMNQKKRERIDVADFMESVRAYHQVDNATDLGVKINNFPLVIQTLKRFTQANEQVINSCILKCESDLTLIVKDAFNHFVASVPFLRVDGKDIHGSGNQENIVGPTQYIREVFSKLHYVYVKIREQTSSYADPKFITSNATLRRIANLRDVFQKEELIGQIFQMAVSYSQDQISDFFNKELARTETQPKPQSILSAEQVVEKLLECLEMCFESGPPSLSALSKIEKKIVDDMQVTHFGDFSARGFLAFLAENEETKKLLEDNGATSLGSSSSSSVSSGTSYRVPVEELKDIARQCLRFSGSERSKIVKTAICNHYKVSDVRETGYLGSFDQLMKSKKDVVQNNVIYESALIGKSLKKIMSKHTVGLNGPMSRDRALVCLHNCPLLYDLSEWSNWDAIFRPEHGDITSFLKKNGGVQQVVLETDGKSMQVDVHALEVRPGKLLKLRSTSSVEEFRKGAEAGDAVATCGHFVSCLVNQGGSAYFSDELFANTLKVSLMESGADEMRDKNIARFILDCLCTIPALIATSLAQKVFLEPIGEVLGNVRSKELILEAAKGDVRKMNRLELLGLHRGISVWFEKSFEEKLAPREVRKKNKKRKRIRDASLEVEEKKVKNKVIILSNDNEVGKETLELHTNDQSVVDETHMRIVTSSTARELDLQITKNEDLETETDTTIPIQPTSFNPAMKSHWRWLVEDIRKEEFGLGKGTTEEEKKLLGKQQDMTGRCLQRLSVDLYSQDAHFLLELVQNADDNQYAGSTIPSLQFSLHKDVIIVSNNEVGFRDIDLRAICDVGNSTKGKHKLGYIGQKGIGFKSVFRVTDRPEIHSRGLHIKFDLSSGALGYVFPHWIDSNGTCADSEALKDDSYTTKIVLPLKMAEQSSGIQSKFQDLHPTLLLFLHRLRQIIIKDEIKGEVRSMTRKDLGGNLTEITHNGGVERWVFVKKVVDASEVSKEAKSGVELWSTELAMAFPIDAVNEQEHQISNFCLPPKQLLFAFLPLRSYGFRFIIHGDFDVPASREDVIDNLWNQWLRSKIHVLFLEALEFFKSKDDCDPIREVCMFFKFVPREDEILDFFRQVALNIINGLKISKCLPSAGESWCYPSQLVMCNDTTIRNFVTSEHLFAQTGLDYLHPMAAKLVDHSILMEVGVQLLNAKHLLQVGKGMIKNIHDEVEDACQISDGHIQQLYIWLCCIHNTLDDLFTDNCDVIESLKAIPFIPLSNGQLVSMDRSVSIFFPFSSGNNSVGGGLGNNNMSKKMVRLLEEDLNSVDSRMFSRSEDQASKLQVTNILERIGVKKLSDKDLVKHHILHSLKDKDKFKTLSKDLLIAYMVCLKNYFQLHPSSFPTSEVVQNLPISTSRGMVKLKRCSVCFSTDYNNFLNLEQQFPGLKWTTLDSSYLNGNKSLSNVSSWREFFLHLGVEDFLSFKKKKSTFDKQTLESSIWQDCAHMLSEGSTCKLEDWNCEEFKQLISMDTNDSSVQQQLKNLFELINKFWEPNENSSSSVKNISQFTQATIKVDGSDQSVSVQSSFGHLLRSSKWIPVWKLDAGEKKQLLVTSPSEHIIAESREAIAILGHHVQYATVKLENLRKSFAEFLGIQTVLEPSYVVRQVVHWSQSASEDSPLRMARVYSYLEDSLSKTELSKLVTERPIIYCPNKFVGGSFLFGREVCWHDETELIEKYFCDPKKLHPMIPRVLSGMYPTSTKDFFTRICNVAISPSAFAYAHVLVNIAATNPVDDSTLASVLNLFTTLEHLLSKETKEEQDHMLGKIAEILKGKRFIPNKAGKWISLEERPIIADNKQFERMFPSCAYYVNVEGLTKGKQNKDSFEFLLRIGVPRLTELVEVQPVTEMFQPCPELCSHVASVVPFIQRCLYFEFPSIYEHLVKEADIVRKLLKMEFAKVQRLELVHHLRWKEAYADGFPRTAVLPKTCHVFDGVVFVEENSINNYLDINRELAFYFSQINKLCPSLTTSCFNELKSLLSEITPLIVHKDETMLGKTLEERNIFRLPPSEEPWIIGKSGLPALDVAETCSSASPVTMETECTSPSDVGGGVAASIHPASGGKSWPLLNHQQNIGFVHQNFHSTHYSDVYTHHHVANYGNHIQTTRPPLFHYPPISQGQLPQVEVDLPVQNFLRDDLDLRVNNCQNPEFSGMSGELYVFDYFKKLSESPDSDIAEVTHMIGEGLTTTPYDIVLKRKSDGGLTFIEVKSTTLQDKTWFEISLQELQFAIEKERDYHVYRVFGIGQESGRVRLTKVENLKEVLNAKQAKLAVVFGEKSNL